MRKIGIIYLLPVIMVLGSCGEQETAPVILQKTIKAIDRIETIYYKQDMARNNPGNVGDTIFRYREMYFKRLPGDSIVGVKGHWYMYVDDKTNVIYEDIYDGNKLIRKNNRDTVARIYDLIKYPEFKSKPFWGHNTLYGMQHEFRYILDNLDTYKVERLKDTLFMHKDCFQILIRLEHKATMPGFAIKLEDSDGSISTTGYLIDKKTHYPIRMKAENYSNRQPEQKFFIDQIYYDIEFNLQIKEDDQFNTSDENLKGYKINEVIPE